MYSLRNCYYRWCKSSAVRLLSVTWYVEVCRLPQSPYWYVQSYSFRSELQFATKWQWSQIATVPTKLTTWLVMWKSCWINNCSGNSDECKMWYWNGRSLRCTCEVTRGSLPTQQQEQEFIGKLISSKQKILNLLDAKMSDSAASGQQVGTGICSRV